MSWRRNLRRASFRGVSFHIDDRGLAGGRRIENHEFPKRDVNYPEDMGRKTRDFDVAAYVIGDDYMRRRDALIAACEREGPGTYIDFWGRSQRVVCVSYEVSETQAEGRMCRINLSFLDAGTGPAPSARAATADLLRGAGAGLLTEAAMRFADAFGVPQRATAVAAAAGVAVREIPPAIRSKLTG